MTLMDPIGDMFTRIRNGQMRNLNSVNIPASKFRSKILEILKTEGYISSFFLESNVNNKYKHDRFKHLLKMAAERIVNRK